MKNYFKVTEYNADRKISFDKQVFFNDSKIRDTQEAYAKAVEISNNTPSKVSVYELPPNPGVWDRVGIVGHRRRGQILLDIETETGEEKEWRVHELRRLDGAYFDAGRDRIPLFEVAAA